jgi:hypothetical protein
MTLSSQKPQRRTSDDYEAGRARRHGLRAVARALGLRDFVELRRPHRRKRESARAAVGREGVNATNGGPVSTRGDGHHSDQRIVVL